MDFKVEPNLLPELSQSLFGPKIIFDLLSVICKIERVSKPGLRVYANAKKLPKVLDNLGIAIISTSKGVMTNLKAKELGIGGEVLCYIW